MMKPARLYANALRRYNRSHGFGIHSPFAYAFVRDTLGCRNQYYAYERIAWLRQVALAVAHHKSRHPRIMSLKNAKMLHRVAVRLGAEEYMQIGSHFGLSTAALLLADSRSQLSLYNPANSHEDVYAEVTKDFRDRIHRLPSGVVGKQIRDYGSRVADGRAFVLVNDVEAADVEAVQSGLSALVSSADCVIVFRNLTRERSNTASLWRAVTQSLTYGMSFTNGNIGVITALRHLPVQHFTLWF